MESLKAASLISDPEDRGSLELELLHSGSQGKNQQVRPPLRARLIEKALNFSKSHSYRRYVLSRHGSDHMYRNLERDLVQGEANRALMRKDCLQANYNDYIPSSFDKELSERDRYINIPFDDIDSLSALPQGEKMLSIGNLRTPFEYLNSNLSFGAISLNKSFIKSNITFLSTNQFSIASSGINQSSIGSIGSNRIPINQSSIGSGASNQVPINQSSIAGINQSSIGSRNENVIVELIKSGMSPGEVAKLSDVFQYPSCFRKVSRSIIEWLQVQRKQGYWNNNSSLFILCLTMALSVGSVETIFKLNSTWGGLIFLVTYLIAFLFIVQPMFCLELGLGQLFRCSPFEIFDKLVPGTGGVGMAMVILCLLSACIASSRTCSEFLIYFLNVFRKNMLWNLSAEDIDKCVSLGGNVTECTKLNPLCYIVDGQCKANRLGKAYLAYQNLFDNPDVDLGHIDYKLVAGITVTYVLVFILQMIGLTNFTFFAFILVVVIFFLSHAQVYFSMLLEGSTSFVFDSIMKIDYKLLYQNSRLWSHSVRCCIYEYVIGNGIYSTLASRSRIGYDLSSEALGVGILSGYITSLQFFSALALVGYFSAMLSKLPADILWMLEQDSSFVLLPMGFIATHNMERTLLVLQFCSCFILITFTLSIQLEVILTTLSRFMRFKRPYVAGVMCTVLILCCIPLCSRGGKRIIWFLEIAVGDLGRVFMVLMTCIVIGWFYGCPDQIKAVGRLSVYVFNATFWTFNIGASLGELLDESLPLYVWWLIRILGIVVATIVAIVIHTLKGPNTLESQALYNMAPPPYSSASFPSYNVADDLTTAPLYENLAESYAAKPNGAGPESENQQVAEGAPKSVERAPQSIEEVPESLEGPAEDGESSFRRLSNSVLPNEPSPLPSTAPSKDSAPEGEGLNATASIPKDNFQDLGSGSYGSVPASRANKARRRERARNVRGVLYVLYIGNIEAFRKEFQRVSPMHKTYNICWSVVWSVCIKWVSCCLLANSLADILEEILSAERVERNIHSIPNKFKIITIVIWVLFIFIIGLYPFLKKYIPKNNKDGEIDLIDLPSCPMSKRKFKFRPGFIFRELF